jgi:hypothetical protein
MKVIIEIEGGIVYLSKKNSPLISSRNGERIDIEVHDYDIDSIDESADFEVDEGNRKYWRYDA